MAEKEWMRRGIHLARKGEGWTSPNPLVGAVIVKDGRVIGEGWHQKRGEAHAERNALQNCREDTKGTTLYVTLEPCCHTGRTPPCTQAIIDAGISRVVIGSRDPNPKVSGQGAEYLRRNGVEVREDFLREECDKLNPIFFHYIATGRPFVAMKYAMTADGKIATKTGDSQWITEKSARNYVHMLRNRYRGIVVGSGTVLADDPMLNCRMEGGRNPVRIVCDRRLRISTESRICQTAGEIPTILVTNKPKPEKARRLKALGVTLLEVSLKKGVLDLDCLMDRLGELEIDSILVEGGGDILGSFLSEHLAHMVHCFVGAKIFGGIGAKSPVGGIGVETVSQGMGLRLSSVKPFPEGDVLLEYCVKEQG